MSRINNSLERDGVLSELFLSFVVIINITCCYIDKMLHSVSTIFTSCKPSTTSPLNKWMQKLCTCSASLVHECACMYVEKGNKPLECLIIPTRKDAVLKTICFLYSEVGTVLSGWFGANCFVPTRSDFFL
jgi:hypothetical protein